VREGGKVSGGGDGDGPGGLVLGGEAEAYVGRGRDEGTTY
jgi:hypothetical protein